MRSDSWTFAIALTASAATLGTAMLLSGVYDPVALGWLTAALALSGLTILSRTPAFLENSGPAILITLLCIAVLFEMFVFLMATPRELMQVPQTLKSPGLLVFVILFCVGLAVAGFPRNLWFPPLAAAHFAFAAWCIFSAPAPVFDVLIFQREGAAALLQGRNPYAMMLPDFYGPGSPYTIPGGSASGSMVFGFNYTPLSLLLLLPAAIAGVDVRWTHLLALTAAAALIAYSRPSRAAPLAAVLLLLMPRTISIAYLSFTEPFALLLLAGTVFAFCRHTRIAPVLLAFFIVVKRHLFITLPVAYLLAPGLRTRRGSRWIIAAIILVSVINVPFLLWDPREFMRSLTGIVFEQNFRMDALTYLAWVAHLGGPRLPSLLGLLAAALASVVLIRRAPETPAGYAASVGIVNFVFFAFNIVDLTNHYYFVFGAFCCAIAAAEPDGSTEHTELRR
jgi:hypothetical protein